jgi:hypothetical protein
LGQSKLVYVELAVKKIKYKAMTLPAERILKITGS